MNKGLCLGAALLVVISSTVSANKLVGKGLAALGAAADLDQLFSQDESKGSESQPNEGSNIGGLLWEQELEIVGGEFEGATMTLNQLLISGSNIALMNGEQVVEIRQTDVSESTLVANITNIVNSNVGYLETEQLAEIINSNIEGESIVQVNTTTIANSNLIGADFKQKFEMEGASVSNSKIYANGIQAN